MERDAELRRYQEERERADNQRAVDLAVSDAMAKQAASNAQAQAASPAPPAPGQAPYQYAAPPIYGSAESYGTPAGSSQYLQPSAAAGSASPRPRSGSAVDSGFQFCPDCGNKCGKQDKFCSRCGRSHGKENLVEYE